MHVLFVTSEVAPLFKLGGLGDVSRSLPMALSRLGIVTTIVLPYYNVIKIAKPTCIGTLAVVFKQKRELMFVFQTTLPGTSVPIILLRHPYLDVYDGLAIVSKFGFFSLGAAVLARQAKSVLGHDVDIVHCQDWHTSLVPLILGENNKLTREHPTVQAKSARTILTIHNLLYQGIADTDIIDELGLPRSIFHVLARHKGEVVNVLREALEYADIISTVSPTYAKEITTVEYGQGLHEVLCRRKDDLVGILNGIETAMWNPARDKELKTKYSAATAASGKRDAKTVLQNELGLPVVNVPLLGFIGRLETKQKGIDILLAALAKLLPTEEFQVVILGNGGARIVSEIRALAKHHPKRLVFQHAFNEPLARHIYAGADLMLVPSKFEPCGLIQIIAMRYGTLPLVRKTGGLADSVEDNSTGFEFTDYTASALADKIVEACELWQKEPDRWKKMVERAIKADFSWEKSAEKYKRLYQKLLVSNK